ncbi:hypothetical protein B0T11DRAFT_133131 [Plectosphaerella cucumerina]|uniref:Uncharacterized protein n=1 Tax=Plectosphaerella cucumerina TaxID=40658 RepID=A0A8K0WZ50_9PEZI|nr:hypothetical protein B0T11DRAFT_133131 [Plectosphaerella cucumerina]
MGNGNRWACRKPRFLRMPWPVFSKVTSGGRGVVARRPGQIRWGLSFYEVQRQHTSAGRHTGHGLDSPPCGLHLDWLPVGNLYACACLVVVVTRQPPACHLTMALYSYSPRTGTVSGSASEKTCWVTSILSLKRHRAARMRCGRVASCVEGMRPNGSFKRRATAAPTCYCGWLFQGLQRSGWFGGAGSGGGQAGLTGRLGQRMLVQQSPQPARLRGGRRGERLDVQWGAKGAKSLQRRGGRGHRWDSFVAVGHSSWSMCGIGPCFFLCPLRGHAGVG